MDIDIPSHYFTQFTDNVELEMQRGGGKLESLVVTESYSGEKAQVVNRLGDVEMTELTTRYSDTEWAEITRSQRWIHPRNFAVHLPVDRIDQLKTLYDLNNPLVKAMAMAAHRKKDDIIAEAFYARAYAGKQGVDSVDWGRDVYGNTLDMTVDKDVGGADSGLNLDKLHETASLFDGQEFDPESGGAPTVVHTHAQLKNLLQTTEVTSSDYNTVRALVNGLVDEFLGFKFKKVSKKLLPKNDAGNRRVTVLAPGAIVMGTWNVMTTKHSERSDKNHTNQLSLYLDANATRIDEKKMVEIECVE